MLSQSMYRCMLTLCCTLVIALAGAGVAQAQYGCVTVKNHSNVAVTIKLEYCCGVMNNLTLNPGETAILCPNIPCDFCPCLLHCATINGVKFCVDDDADIAPPPGISSVKISCTELLLE